MGEAAVLKVRFTNRAVHQIDEALDYIAARSPNGERAVRVRMRELVTMLEDHPYAGHRTS
jgi:toxin ParE1/3/4